MTNDLAPVGLTVYTRVWHTIQCIEALKENDLAKETELYIFSDAAKKGDEHKVEKMRKYLRTISGFKRVVVIERQENDRVKNNRGGQKYLLDKYGKAIWLAEDILTSQCFLTFMNEALKFYQDNEKVTFVSGYVIPGIDLESSQDDVFFLGRFESWGFAFWKRSFKYFNYISDAQYKAVYNSKKELKKLSRRIGDEGVYAIPNDYTGKIDGGDLKVWFWQYIFDTYTLYPRISLTRSNGLDGSGVHMGITDKWDIDKLWGKPCQFEFKDVVAIDPSIERMNTSFYKRTLKDRVSLFLQKIRIHGAVKFFIRKMPKRI